jgi:hypothetical protein
MLIFLRGGSTLAEPMISESLTEDTPLILLAYFHLACFYRRKHIALRVVQRPEFPIHGLPRMTNPPPYVSAAVVGYMEAVGVLHARGSPMSLCHFVPSEAVLLCQVCREGGRPLGMPALETLVCDFQVLGINLCNSGENCCPHLLRLARRGDGGDGELPDLETLSLSQK